MSSLRLLSCTVRRPVTLPSSLRPLCASYNITSRSVVATAFQRLALDNCSRRPAGFRAPFGASNLSTSPYHGDDAQKNQNGEEKEERRLQSESKLMAKQVYQAPMSRAVRLMKAVSVTSCTLTSIGMPVLCLVSEQDTSTIGKWAMCGTIMMFGLGTTSLFHYLFKPYVMKMWLASPGVADSCSTSESEATDDPVVTVETVTLFAQLTQNSFRLSDVSPPKQSMHPMVSFQARDHHYFIHPEAFEDRNLLTRLGAGKRA